MSAKSGEGEHGDAGGGGEDEGVRFTRRARRRGCGSGRWSRKSGPGGARTKVSAGARRGRATTSARSVRYIYKYLDFILALVHPQVIYGFPWTTSSLLQDCLQQGDLRRTVPASMAIRLQPGLYKNTKGPWCCPSQVSGSLAKVETCYCDGVV